ncbi:MAG: hypothetical protein J1F43_01875 [Muribaculaceae bacterium]|nr:hypothetical protein [Muribaculaceae bacterium]
MENTTKKILASISLLGISMCANAQGLSLTEERDFLLKSLRLLDNYEYNSTLRSTEDIGEYLSLFADENQEIFNDLLGISAEETLPLQEYVELFKNNAISPAIKLKNVRRGEIQDMGETIVMPLLFEKEMRYNNSCGAILSSNNYYGADYQMKMVLEMNKATGEIQIISLTGNIDSNRPRLGKDFAIVEYDDPRNREVTNNGQKLNFNVFDQAFIPLPYNLSYPDDDMNMKVIASEGECRKLNITFHPRKFMLKPRVNISLGRSFTIDDSASLMDISSSSMEFGLDFGYILPMKGNFKINLMTGLGYSTGKIDLAVGDLNYNYAAPGSADIDGVAYTRYYEITNLSQGISLNHLTIPIYGDFEYKFSKYVSAYLQVGVKMYCNMGSKVNRFTGDMYAYGVYPEYGDLMINAPYMNDFGNSTIDESTNNDLKFNGAAFDGFGGLGVRAKIYGPLSIEAGINYQVGFSNVIVNTRQPGELITGSITESQAFATYTASEGTMLHSLTDYVGNIKRSGLKLNIGLIVKF